MIFEQNFDGPLGSLPLVLNFTPEIGDGRKYNLIGWGNKEEQYYIANGSVMDGCGNLVITSQLNSTMNLPSNSVPSIFNINPYLTVGNSTWTSGKLVTKNKMCFLYGSLRFTIKMPNNIGNDFAIWMLGYDYPRQPWPQTGEIDIIEYWNRDQYTLAPSANSIAPNGTTIYRYNHYNIYPINPSETFNTYGIDWDPSGIRFYFNEIEIQNINKERDYLNQTPPYDYPFDKPFYLIFNNAIGGNTTSVEPGLTLTQSYIKNFSFSSISSGPFQGFGNMYIQTYQPNSPWNHFRGIYSTNDGSSPFSGTTTGYCLWSYITDSSSIFSTPVIDACGNIYVGCDNGSLYCLDFSGTLKWKTSSVSGKIRSTPSIGSFIYVATMDIDVNNLPDPAFNGSVYSYDTNGNLIHSVSIGSSIWSSVAIAPNKDVIIADCSGYLYAFDVYLTQKWKIKINDSITDSRIYSSPTIGADGIIYIGSYNGKLYAVNEDTGTILWSYTITNGSYSAEIYGTCAIYENILYFGANNGLFYAIDTISSNNTPLTNTAGTQLWSFNTFNPYTGVNGGNSFGSPAIGPNGIYFTSYFGLYDGGSYKTRLYALNNFGGFKWYYEINERAINGESTQTRSSPIVDSNDNIYIATQSGNIIGLHDNTDYCTVLFNISISSLDYAIYGSLSMDNNGILYCGTLDGKVYAISINPDILTANILDVKNTSIEVGWQVETNVNVDVYNNGSFLQTVLYPNTQYTVSNLESKSSNNISLTPYIVIQNVDKSQSWKKYGNAYYFPTTVCKRLFFFVNT
jgi:outer membrane protein assembly factor BamB